MESAIKEILRLAQTDHTTILHRDNQFVEIEASGVYIAKAIHYRAIQLGLMSTCSQTTVIVSIYTGAPDANIQKPEPPEEGSVHNRRAD